MVLILSVPWYGVLFYTFYEHDRPLFWALTAGHTAFSCVGLAAIKARARLCVPCRAGPGPQ